MLDKAPEDVWQNYEVYLAQVEEGTLKTRGANTTNTKSIDRNSTSVGANTDDNTSTSSNTNSMGCYKLDPALLARPMTRSGLEKL